MEQPDISPIKTAEQGANMTTEIWWLLVLAAGAAILLYFIVHYAGSFADSIKPSDPFATADPMRGAVDVPAGG